MMNNSSEREFLLGLSLISSSEIGDQYFGGQEGTRYSVQPAFRLVIKG